MSDTDLTTTRKQAISLADLVEVGTGDLVRSLSEATEREKAIAEDLAAYKSWGSIAKKHRLTEVEVATYRYCSRTVQNLVILFRKRDREIALGAADVALVDAVETYKTVMSESYDENARLRAADAIVRIAQQLKEDQEAEDRVEQLTGKLKSYLDQMRKI